MNMNNSLLTWNNLAPNTFIPEATEQKTEPLVMRM